MSSISSFSSSSASMSPPPNPRRTLKTPVSTKPSHDGPSSASQRPFRSKPIKTTTNPKSSKTHQKSKTTAKPKPKTPTKPRQQRPSFSAAAKKPYIKPAPPPSIPNITSVGVMHDPIPAHLHNAPSPVVRTLPPLSIQPLATIHLIEAEGASQPLPPRSPIIISSPGSPHTPSGTLPITPSRPSSDSPASERNIVELAELAQRDVLEVFGAILASLNQGQEEEEQVMHPDPTNTSLESDEVERYAMMLEV
ncbi:proline-rich receptor-like protein kinase PERK2 [Benincasa hispida]|uniref:proline-rich receptor-like protein kinase PERK2 n=1 Tax=Benincasa hispida TaxID=102211 RepID=UPI0019005CD8|nr:proline-rich receptor-like protein kinase PERK2 [Benincasa hispida]